MNSSPWFFPAISMVLAAAATCQAQTLEDALDTPGRSWTPSGSVSALNDPGASHDGVDVVRLDAPVSTSGPFPAVSTVLTVPSVVEFQHRGRSVADGPTLGLNGVAAGFSHLWQARKRIGLPGTLEISNRGSSTGSPLFLDEVSIRPAVSVSLAEGLDWPAGVEILSGTASQAIGLAESEVALDGVDAVYFQENATIATLPVAPGLMSYRSRRPDGTDAFTPGGSASGIFPWMTLGDRTWTWVRTTERLVFNPVLPVAPSSVLDDLGVVPVVSAQEALDITGAAVVLSGFAQGTTLVPPGTDGDAVLCLGDPVNNPTGGGAVSLTVSGPSVVRYRFLGAFKLDRQGIVGSQQTAATWQNGEINLPVGGTLTWRAIDSLSQGFWLDALEVSPAPAEKTVAGLLDAPGVGAEFPVPILLGGATELGFQTVSPAALMPAVRLPFQGPALVSLVIKDSTKTVRVRLDGGAWQAPFYPITSASPNVPFVIAVPEAGPRALEISGAVTQDSFGTAFSAVASLDQFVVAPLDEIPLSSFFADAGFTSITTSSATPWKAYTTPAAMGIAGNKIATGGAHAVAADPWVEISVSGPGILRSNHRLQAVNGYPLGGFSGYSFTGMEMNGLAIQISSPVLWLGPGNHTVRWKQGGSQITTGVGSLATLSGVTFESSTSVGGIGEEVEAPLRTWITGGTGGSVLAVPAIADHFPPEDHVLFRENVLGGTPWLGTMVQLPCRVKFKGSNVECALGDGTILHRQSGTGQPEITVPGNGRALLKFTLYRDVISAFTMTGNLENVVIHESTGELVKASALGPAGVNWTEYSNRPYLEMLDQETGGKIYYTQTGMWTETIFNGPGSLSAMTATLPEHDNRLAANGWLPFPGPQRVLLQRPAGSYHVPGTYRPLPSVETVLATPGVTWSHGGDVPWIAAYTNGAASASLWPGETSWLEASVTGPGEFTWSAGSSLNQITYETAIFYNDELLFNDLVPGVLQLSPGIHRIRWLVSLGARSSRNDQSAVYVSRPQFIPQPVDSVSQILSNGTVSFEGGKGWQVVDDAQLPGKAFQTAATDAGPLRALVPPGTSLTSLLKMEPDGGTITTAGADSLPGGAAPFPWSPAGSVWPVRPGFRTTVAQVSAVLPTPVTPTLAEALDHPTLVWTVGGTVPGLLQTGIWAASPTADKDGVFMSNVPLGESAWLEASVTGPVNLTTLFNRSRSSDTGFRILLNGVPVLEENQSGTAFLVPPGTHVVRWELKPNTPLEPGQLLRIMSVSTAPASAPPNLDALLDTAGLQWAATGTLTSNSGTNTHDGVDALGLNGQLTIAGDGPALVSFWTRGASSTSVTLDGFTVPLPTATGPWVKWTIPIPAGRHFIRYSGSSGRVLDEWSWTVLPVLTPATALDLPTGSPVVVEVPEADQIGAAAYTGFTDDATDSLMMMPERLQRLKLKLPPGGTISFRIRAAFGTGTVSLQEQSSVSVTTAWIPLSFATQGGLPEVTIRSRNVPMMIDKLALGNAAASSGYFDWAAGFPWPPGQDSNQADPDGDGYSNTLEYAFGLNPMLPDSGTLGTATVPGAPVVELYRAAPDQPAYLEIRYWRRNGASAYVETAGETGQSNLTGQSSGWIRSMTPVTTTSPGPAGWFLHVWRSPVPVTPGSRVFARVRTVLPY